MTEMIAQRGFTQFHVLCVYDLKKKKKEEKNQITTEGLFLIITQKLYMTTVEETKTFHAQPP